MISEIPGAHAMATVKSAPPPTAPPTYLQIGRRTTEMLEATFHFGGYRVEFAERRIRLRTVRLVHVRIIPAEKKIALKKRACHYLG